jgi:APA family basic amino acid/polyamine antiporter
VQAKQLKRELGVSGATLMGLGSIIGTGIFVSVGIAAGVAGPSVLIAIGIAALVATCNGLSSAQLAASHPVSGGTYEYGYRYLRPSLGFTAGWVFLLAKSASAATAALGFSGYLLDFLGIDSARWLTPVALLAWAGLAACLFLAFWVETRIWVLGLLLIALGLLWHWLAGRWFSAA